MEKILNGMEVEATETQSVDFEQQADVNDVEPKELVAEENNATQSDNSNDDIDNNKALKGRLNAYEQKGYKRGLVEAEKKYAKELKELEEFKIEREALELSEKENVSLEIAKRIIKADRILNKSTAYNNFEPEQAEVEHDALGDDMAQELLKQNEFVKKAYGVDSLEIFNNASDEIKARVASGEIDFIDLAKMNNEPKRVPATVKSPNAGKLEAVNIKSMNSKDFEELDRRLARGSKYDF